MHTQWVLPKHTCFILLKHTRWVLLKYTEALNASYSNAFGKSHRCSLIEWTRDSPSSTCYGLRWFPLIFPPIFPVSLLMNLPSVQVICILQSRHILPCHPPSQRLLMRWKWGNQDGDKGELGELRSCFDPVRNHSLGESGRWLFYLLSCSSCCIGWCNNTITQRQTRRTIFQLISKYLRQATFSVHFLLWYVLCFQCYE